MSITIKKCTLQDLHKLNDISIQTFDDTFRTNNKSENIDAYLENVFKLSLLEKEFKHPSSEFYFIYYNNHVAGYLKLNISDEHEASHQRTCCSRTGAFGYGSDP